MTKYRMDKCITEKMKKRGKYCESYIPSVEIAIPRCIDHADEGCYDSVNIVMKYSGSLSWVVSKRKKTTSQCSTFGYL